MSDLRATFGSATSVGRRALNEDSFALLPPIFVVADGMGGHEAGEVASAIAVREFEDLAGRWDITADDVVERLTTAGERVRQLETAPGFGAGTTVVGACLTRQGETHYWLVFNIGDSRAYRLTGGELTQISVDHSEVQELLESGELTTETVRDYDRRHVVTRALGADGLAEPDFWVLPVGENDRVLLCSDGLTGEVSDDDIAHLLLAHPDPTLAAQALVTAALAAGGSDNITALIVDAVGAGALEVETLPRSVGAANDDTIPTPTGGSRA